MSGHPGSKRRFFRLPVVTDTQGSRRVIWPKAQAKGPGREADGGRGPRGGLPQAEAEARIADRSAEPPDQVKAQPLLEGGNMTNPFPQPGIRRIDLDAEAARLAEARKAATARPDRMTATAKCVDGCGATEAVTYPEVLALIRDADSHSALTGHRGYIEVWTNGKPT